MNRIRVLFLAANPNSTTPLRLDEEIRAITQKLRASEYRDEIDLESKWSVRPDDLLQYLNEHKPHIVHFSGHGSKEGEIILVDNKGQIKPVDPKALTSLFSTLKDNIQIVLLNACFSRKQGQAINEVIDFVVGMDDAIGDDASIVFAASFYRAIGFDRTVQEAFDQAITALMLEGIPEENIPELLVREGVNPNIKISMVNTQGPSGPIKHQGGLTKSDSAHSPVQEKLRKFVDRDDERKLFQDMITGKTTVHILLMQAGGGMGKTLLLDKFWNSSKDLRRARVDFKDSSYGVGKILGELRDQYGPESFTVFHAECRNHLPAITGHSVTHDNMIPSAIDVGLTKKSGDELKYYQRLFTSAFLADLQNIRQQDKPVVVLFDTYEKASDAVKAWITELLINEIRRYSWLVCVITGRERPRIPTGNETWCLEQTLKHLSEEHRVEYIQTVKFTQNEELVSFITRHSEGNPLKLQQLVQTLVED